MVEKKKVYLICPVRGVSDDEKDFLDKYVAGLESSGFQVHYPPRDVEQNDSSGINIMISHREAMKNSDEVHAYWNGKSQGSYVDFGMFFMMKYFNQRLKFVLANEIQRTQHKSFENVLLDLESEKD